MKIIAEDSKRSNTVMVLQILKIVSVRRETDEM